ncbi:MAG TPA: FHA domain-containing protein [Armatimonadota bacterium]|nr:FHA domain-containing protein [Armatimonadota bacterium]
MAQPNAARFPEVTLYAYPTDARGLLMSGLSGSAFRVTENGLPAQVVRVEARGGTLDLCLALDRSPSMLDDRKLDFAKLAAQELLKQLGTGDRAALVSYATGTTLDQPLTGDISLLQAAVEREQASGTSTNFMDGVYWAVSQVGLASQGASVLGSASGRSDARRVVLALTDGNDRGSRIGTVELINHARANGVSICTVALGGDAATDLLEYLAKETGGVYLRAPGPQDLQRLYVSLAQQLRSEYRVTIRSPKPAADATRRELQINLASTPLTAATWYQAPGQGSLLVTAPPGTDAGASVSGSAAAGGLPPAADPSTLSRLAIGALLIVLGLGGVLAALLFWLGSRRRQTLDIVDSNPRVDLLPLWVREGTNRVGRGAECELVLDSRQVSRVHARIEVAGGVFYLFDEGSANGTWVNGRRVKRGRELRIGDVLRFGDREFRFAGELPV